VNQPDLDFRRRCARCGRPVLDFADLAATAERARVGLAEMRLAIPDSVSKGVPLLAASLSCLAGVCHRDRENTP